MFIKQTITAIAFLVGTGPGYAQTVIGEEGLDLSVAPYIQTQASGALMQQRSRVQDSSAAQMQERYRLRRTTTERERTRERSNSWNTRSRSGFNGGGSRGKGGGGRR